MKSLVILLPLIFGSVVSADIVTLTNGTSVEGTIKRTPDGYIVTSAGGAETLVPFDQVAGFKKTAAPATPGMSESALTSLRRATGNMDDLQKIIDRYQTFITQNAGSPAATDAQKDLSQWQERLDKKMVKAGADRVTPEQFEKLKAIAAESAAKVVPMIAAGRLKEASTEVDRALAIAPGNADLQYLKGVIAYKQIQLAPARTAFQAAALSAPDHGPSHNNAGVALAKTNSAMPALAEFEKAMESLPSNQTILDNVAEVLHALPPANQKNPITKRVDEMFKAQDAVLQRKMAESGLYRWGSKWLDKAEYAVIQQQQKELKDKLDAIKKQFEDNQTQLIKLTREINDDQNLMIQMQTNNVMTDGKGNQVAVPPPPQFYDIQRDQNQCYSKRDQINNQQKALDQTFQQQARQGVQETYTGTLTIFEADALPSAPPPAMTQPSAASPGQLAGSPTTPAPVTAPPGMNSKPGVATAPGAPPRPKGTGDY